MTNFEAIVSELEWRRLRQRLMKNWGRAALLTFATWAVIAVLKPVPR